VTFFFDRIIAVGVVIQLRAEGRNLIHLEEMFPPSAKDVDWIAVVGREGWVLLTTDRRIRSRKVEKRALRRAQITTFFCNEGLSGKHAAGKVQWLRDHWDKIEERAATAQKGEHFSISENGQIKKMPDL
jgi:hypothetical protein